MTKTHGSARLLIHLLANLKAEFMFYFSNPDWSHEEMTWLDDYLRENWTTSITILVSLAMILLPEPSTTIMGGASLSRIVGNVMLGTEIGLFLTGTNVYNTDWMYVILYNSEYNESRSYYVEYQFVNGILIIVSVKKKAPFGVKWEKTSI